MRSAFVIFVSLLFLGCEKPVPKLSEATLQKVRADAPGITDSCIDMIRWGGFEAMPEAVDQCFVMTEPRRWRGYWRNDFEGSAFCPGPAKDCRPGGDDIWLTYANKKGPAANDYRPGGLYAVDFIGRLTVHKGQFGHMGMSDREMIVDRMLSIREIEPPPPEPTKAQIVAHMKACEANRTCIPNWDAINQMDETKE